MDIPDRRAAAVLDLIGMQRIQVDNALRFHGDLEKRLEESQERCSELERENVTLQEELERSRESLDSLDNENKRIVSELRDAKDSYSGLQTQMKDIEYANLNLQGQLANAEALLQGQATIVEPQCASDTDSKTSNDD